jgi:hypothetical protein
MKKILLSISLLALAYTASANVPVIKSDPKIEAQVEQTLKKLTLEEKIGQMMELVTDLFGANDKNGVFYIDEHKTDSILSRYKIGSILNAPNTCAPTAKQWEKYIAQIQKISMKRIGIPCVFGLDQNHGSTYTQGGTLFPQNINVAATFNREIARRSAEATAYETRAVSVPWTYSPTVDLGRDARWPRIWENFGEDCYLSSEMGKAMVYGFQGEDPNNIDQYHIATSMKHFMGYGVPWTGKDRTPAYISPADLREKHFAPFLAGLQAGAYNTWKFCGEQTHDRILAYAVELTGAANGTVQGNLYELDYQQHFQHIRDAALPVGANRLIYESGMREIGPKEHFDSRPDKYFGEFVRYEMQPRDPELLQAAIRQEQRSRESAQPGDSKCPAGAPAGAGRSGRQSRRIFHARL